MWLLNNYSFQCVSSQTISITSPKSTRPSQIFLCMLGRPEYEIITFALDVTDGIMCTHLPAHTQKLCIQKGRCGHLWCNDDVTWFGQIFGKRVLALLLLLVVHLHQVTPIVTKWSPSTVHYRFVSVSLPFSHWWPPQRFGMPSNYSDHHGLVCCLFLSAGYIQNITHIPRFVQTTSSFGLNHIHVTSSLHHKIDQTFLFLKWNRNDCECNVCGWAGRSGYIWG